MFDFFSKPVLVKTAEAAPAPVQPAAAAAQPDTKVGYLSADELNTATLTPLFEVAGGPALVMGYVSPANDVSYVASSIKRVLPPNAKLILVTTSGELCRPAGSRSIPLRSEGKCGSGSMRSSKNRSRTADRFTWSARWSRKANCRSKARRSTARR